jgi:hypothetical protein
VSIWISAFDVVAAAETSVEASVVRVLHIAANVMRDAYDRAPVLVLVLAALLVVPLVALMSYLISGFMYRAGAAEHGEGSGEPQAEEFGDAAWPSQAWIEIEGQTRSELPMRETPVRIGRHEENEILIPDTTVHRYHAIIQRTHESDYVITDVSGDNGNGVLINGERYSQARLFDGDIIQLGSATLRFGSALL